MRLTPAQTRMLDRIRRAKSPVLLVSLAGSGGQSAQTLHSLIKHGLVKEVDHPTVKEPAPDRPRHMSPSKERRHEHVPARDIDEPAAPLKCPNLA